MPLALLDVPLGVRRDSAIALVGSGEMEPLDALAVVVWPDADVLAPCEEYVPLGRCQRGHAMTPENTYVRPDGTRNCRTCVRSHTRTRNPKPRSDRTGTCERCGGSCSRRSKTCRACWTARKEHKPHLPGRPA